MKNPIPHIAVVDDEESVRRALQRLLLSAGFAVETFASGADFLAAINQRVPVCVVLDVHMPVMNGIEVLSRLKQNNSAIPVIVITGHDTTETGPRALAAGAVEFLCKPVDGQLLLNSINSAIVGVS